MTLEQYKELCKKFPILSKLVNGIVVPIAGVVALFGLIIVCFIGSQMFDDKRTYDSGSTVVDFVNWFKDTTKDAVNSAIQEKLDEHHESDQNVVEVDQNGSTNNVGSTQTDVHE